MDKQEPLTPENLILHLIYSILECNADEGSNTFAVLQAYGTGYPNSVKLTHTAKSLSCQQIPHVNFTDISKKTYHNGREDIERLVQAARPTHGMNTSIVLHPNIGVSDPIQMVCDNLNILIVARPVVYSACLGEIGVGRELTKRDLDEIAGYYKSIPGRS